MHYGIVAIGSRGDVQPYIALALGLKERGHRVTLMAHENFKTFTEGYGIEFHALTGSVQELLLSDEGLAVLKAGHILAFVRYLQKIIKRTQKEVNQDILSGSAKADVLVSSLLGIAWVASVAEKLNKPWAMVQLNLPATPTKYFPLAPLAFLNFPFYNLLTYRLFEIFFWLNNRKPVNDFRRSLGLPVLQRSILKRIAEEKILNLHCFSPSLVARPDDWSPQVDITGFLFLPKKNRDENLQDTMPADLLQWLASGDQPIYIGFGSIPIPDPALFAQILTVLLAKTKYRFIFCQGWSKAMAFPVNERLFVVQSVNHDSLLPRCKLAIIHGGVGTTAAVLKAKIPLIIVSIIADQPWWGKLIETKQLGVHLPFKKLTTEKLITAIKTTDTTAYRLRLSQTGERINLEDGLAKTIYRLDEYFGSII